MTDDSVRSGGCLCGAVRFEIAVPEAKFSICHCGMCRKWSAGPFMTVHCSGEPTFENQEGLAWYPGSEWAERGFCSRCGSSLFYRLTMQPDPDLIVSVEAFDDADDMILEPHIYVDALPQRYQFGDSRPRVTEAEFLKELGITPLEES